LRLLGVGEKKSIGRVCRECDVVTVIVTSLSSLLVSCSPLSYATTLNGQGRRPYLIISSCQRSLEQVTIYGQGFGGASLTGVRGSRRQNGSPWHGTRKMEAFVNRPRRPTANGRMATALNGKTTPIIYGSSIGSMYTHRSDRRRNVRTNRITKMLTSSPARSPTRPYR